MASLYGVFDFINCPVVVFSPEGEIVFRNKPYTHCLKNADFNGFEKDAACDRGIIFSSEKGLVRCYHISFDTDDFNNKICVFKDITPFVSRKSMTEIIASDGDLNNDYALRKIVEKNARMATMIDSMESGILLEGSSGSLIQVNNSFLRMIASKFFHNLPENEYDANFYHKILAEMTDTADYFGDKDRIVSDNSYNTYTDEVKFKDGRIFIRTFQRLYVGGEPKGSFWKFKDITIRKALESFNIELEANLRALESSEAVGIYMEYSGYRFVNRGLEKLLNADRETLMAQGLSGFIPGGVAPDPAGPQERTVRLKHSDGKEVFLNLVADSLTIAGKQASIVTLKDTTENVLLHRDLEKNETKFRNIFEKNLAVMLIFDPKTMLITDANRSAVEFYGKSMEELRGLGMCDITLVGNMNECTSNLKDIIVSQTGQRIPVHQIVADGSVHEVDLLMTPLGSDEGDLLFVIVDDVHERVKYERELESLNENLMEMVEKEAQKRRRQEELLMEKSRLAEMGEMIGNIAHQWRQPLNALGFIIQDIYDAHSCGDLTEEYVSESVTNGMEQIDYMSKTIDDFRDFFRPSAKTTDFDVKESVGQVLSIFLPQVKNKGVDLFVGCDCENGSAAHQNTDRLEFCENHDLRIRGYSNQFKQVLLNLLSNSRYAVQKSDEKRIDIRIGAENGRVKIKVEDSGGGIPDKIMDKIFDPYFTTKSDSGGTGIGLYMSKAIVEENLGGSLYAENIDKGCRITIEVDRVKD